MWQKVVSLNFFLCCITIKLANLLWVPFRSLSRFYSCRPAFQEAVPALLSDYRQCSFTMQDGYSEWKGQGGLLFLHREETLLGLLQLKKLSTVWELSSFVVNPQFQGRGYGKGMLSYALNHVDTPVCLRVKQENPAQMLYKSMGFQTEACSNGRYIMKYLK